MAAESSTINTFVVSWALDDDGSNFVDIRGSKAIAWKSPITFHHSNTTLYRLIRTEHISEDTFLLSLTLWCKKFSITNPTWFHTVAKNGKYFITKMKKTILQYYLSYDKTEYTRPHFLFDFHNSSLRNISF